MIAKVVLFLAALAIVHSTLVAPGLLNAGLAPWGGAVTTGSVVSIPGAVSTDKRVIGGWAGAPLAGGLWANGLWGARGLGWGNGLLAAPGLAKAVW